MENKGIYFFSSQIPHDEGYMTSNTLVFLFKIRADRRIRTKMPLGSRGIWIARVQQGQSKYTKTQGSSQK